MNGNLLIGLVSCVHVCICDCIYAWKCVYENVQDSVKIMCTGASIHPNFIMQRKCNKHLRAKFQTMNLLRILTQINFALNALNCNLCLFQLFVSVAVVVSFFRLTCLHNIQMVRIEIIQEVLQIRSMQKKKTKKNFIK